MVLTPRSPAQGTPQSAPVLLQANDLPSIPLQRNFLSELVILAPQISTVPLLDSHSCFRIRYPLVSCLPIWWPPLKMTVTIAILHLLMKTLSWSRFPMACGVITFKYVMKSIWNRPPIVLLRRTPQRSNPKKDIASHTLPSHPHPTSGRLDSPSPCMVT